MRYSLLLFATFLFTCINGLSADLTGEADSSFKQPEYKNSKPYFLKQYGKDDSTKALINYFFKKR